jgi:hypothetical protein
VIKEKMKKQIITILIALMLITSFSLAAMLSTSADNTKYLSVNVYGWHTLYERYEEDAKIYEDFPFIVKVEYDAGEYYEPVEDAAVRIKGETKYTDKSGKVTFDAPEVDSLDESKYFKLTVSKDGFSDRTKNVRVYSARWSQTVDEYVWNETEDYWVRAWTNLQPRIYENMTFMLRVERDGYNFNSKDVPVENASVTFLKETKYTNKNGEVTFIAPVIPVGKKKFKVVSIVEDTEKIDYDEGYETYTTNICVYKRQTTETGRVKHFTRTDSDGYTTKFDITGKTWRVEWDYSTSSKHPYFSYNLLDTHGHIIQGCSSSDAKYNSHGVVYLEGSGEDFYFQVWDANLWSWSIDVYQED